MPTPPNATSRARPLVIFDLDGTLVDSAGDIATAVNRMRRELGHREKPLDTITQWVGNGSAMLVKRSLSEALDLPLEDIAPAIFQTAHVMFFKHYRQCNGDTTTLYDGVLTVLQELQQQNIPLAICTNKPAEFTHALLKKLSIDHFFTCVVSGDTLAVKKPDAAPLLFCAEQCGIAANQCLMVGDSMTDVRAAQNARMPVVCVSYGYHRGDDLARECEVLKDFSLLLHTVAALRL